MLEAVFVAVVCCPGDAGFILCPFFNTGMLVIQPEAIRTILKHAVYFLCHRSDLYQSTWAEGQCCNWRMHVLKRVTWRRQNKPTSTQEPKQLSTHGQQRTIARSSANLMKPNRTPSQKTLVQDTMILYINQNLQGESTRGGVAVM